MRQRVSNRRRMSGEIRSMRVKDESPQNPPQEAKDENLPF